MNNITKTLAVAGLALMAFAPQAHAMGTPEAAEFVSKASIGGNFEVQSSQIALQKSQNADVKAFAQHMISDHTAAGNTLKSTAQQAGFGSSVSESLDKKHQKMLDKLSKEDDQEDFNEKYISYQTKAHKKTIDLFQDYADKGDNSALKTFASNTLPTLKAHEDEVKALEDKVDAAE